MNFKFFKGKDTFYLEPTQQLVLRGPEYRRHVNNEYCFQFGDSEPVVFASGQGNITITLSPTENCSMIFNNEGQTFKLFARENA